MNLRLDAAARFTAPGKDSHLTPIRIFVSRFGQPQALRKNALTAMTYAACGGLQRETWEPAAVVGLFTHFPSFYFLLFPLGPWSVVSSP
jgi:hypothetical protein